jgi:hypothetical protein
MSDGRTPESRAAGAVTPAEVARRMRAALDATDFRTEGHRKAALRRLLHENAAGMDENALAAFLEDVRGRFPDRIFEATSRVRQLEGRLEAIDKEARDLRDEVARLREKSQSGEGVLARIFKTVGEGADRAGGVVSGSLNAPPTDPEAQARFADVVSALILFAIDQDATSHTVEESLGRGQTGGRDVTLADLARRIARGEGRVNEDTAELERRLRRMRLMPAALLAGIQQSWKGGTRGVLEYLDPKAAEAEVPKRLPGLREAAVLKEVRRRYEEFWDELDKNIAHYYRGTFEKVYSEKMEGRS